MKSTLNQIALGALTMLAIAGCGAGEPDTSDEAAVSKEAVIASDDISAQILAFAETSGDEESNIKRSMPPGKIDVIK